MKSFKEYLNETMAPAIVEGGDQEPSTPEAFVADAMKFYNERNAAEFFKTIDAFEVQFPNESRTFFSSGNFETIERTMIDLLDNNSPAIDEDLEDGDMNDDPTMPGWYLVDTGNGQVCDGPFETSRLASERKSYSSESPQFWNGSEWTEDDTTRRLAQLAGVRY